MADSHVAQPPTQLVPTSINPPIPSPLNPDAPPRPSQTPAPAREQREKKESLKKRESNTRTGRADTPSSSTTTLGKRKANAAHAHPSPQRFAVPEVQGRDFAPPAEDRLASHEPFPFVCPDGTTELYKPVDLAENKKGYRYQRCIADPIFPHKQFFRTTSPPPHAARLSFEDADRWMHFTTNALLATNEKGWRMARANVCAREGTLYYEVRMVRGVPPADEETEGLTGPQPHVRVGWARREAPLDAPVGFDGYSYGITDIRSETMHRSRPGKFFHPKPKPKSKASKPAPPAPVVLPEEDAHLREGDVLGLEITLPSLSLHQKVVSGVYNPAVDIGDGFDQPHARNEPGSDNNDVIRDRIPVPYKGNSYFEIIDHVSSKPMEQYADRALALSTLGQPAASTTNQSIKQAPHANHPEPSLRTLPHSSIRVYKNGRAIGTAFENLLAFLPPASAPSKVMGAREGFDDGAVGYFPAVSCFHGGIAEMNFGDGPEGFWAPPAHLTSVQTRQAGGDKDVVMGGTADANAGATAPRSVYSPSRACRAIGERYREQVAEDVVWDVVDEVDFFMQDGGYGGRVGQGAEEVKNEGRRGRLKEEVD